MKGMSETLLREVYQALLDDFGKHPNDLGIKTCLEGLINRCEELNPWLPVDENTPRYKPLLVLDQCFGEQVATRPKGEDYFVTEFGNVLMQVTHYQELPEAPL